MPTLAGRSSSAWNRRWILVWQNALVTNAAALMLGCGGLRTPCTAANLWATAGLLAGPAFGWLWRQSEGARGALRRHAERHIHDGPVVQKAFVVLVPLLALSAIAAILVPLLVSAVFLVIRLPSSLPATAVRPVPWGIVLAQGALTVALLGTVRTATTPRVAAAQQAMRAIGWLPPIGWAALTIVDGDTLVVVFDPQDREPDEVRIPLR